MIFARRGVLVNRTEQNSPARLMNYFAHGMRFTGRPYMLAGTAAPDWLSAVDRKVRLRPGRVEPLADGTGTVQAEVAAGVLRHLEDDRWFHRTAVFYETSGQLTRLVRHALGTDDGFRPGFLGHILTELVLDGVLIDSNPRALDAYYRALAEVDPEQVQTAVNCMATKQTSCLASFIPLFCREEFLRDYLEPERLLYRVNQVMRRVGLRLLPDEFADVLATAWTVVRPRRHLLLPDG